MVIGEDFKSRSSPDFKRCLIGYLVSLSGAVHGAADQATAAA